MNQPGYDLHLQRGASVNQPFLLRQNEYSFAQIEDIQPTSPIRLVVTGHGLPDFWPVWVEDVKGTPDIVRARPAVPLLVDKVDDNTLSIPGSNGFGLTAGGGTLVFNAPYDLTNAVAEIRVFDPAGEVLETWTNGAGLEVDPLGGIFLVLAGATTRAITWDSATYEMTVALQDGITTLFFDMGNIMVTGRAT